MKYEITKHARDALEKRQIKISWLESALKNPEWTEQDTFDTDLRHYFIHISEFGNHVLRVIVNINTAPPRIVTAYFDRRRK